MGAVLSKDVELTRRKSRRPSSLSKLAIELRHGSQYTKGSTTRWYDKVDDGLTSTSPQQKPGTARYRVGDSTLPYPPKSCSSDGCLAETCNSSVVGSPNAEYQSLPQLDDIGQADVTLTTGQRVTNDGQLDEASGAATNDKFGYDKSDDMTTDEPTNRLSCRTVTTEMTTSSSRNDDDSAALSSVNQDLLLPFVDSTNRHFVIVRLDVQRSYTWGFLTVSTPTPPQPAEPSGESASNCSATPGDRSTNHVVLGISKNADDFPPLGRATATGAKASLLHDAVIHCLPHGRSFDRPIYVGVRVPRGKPRSRRRRLTIFYSDTDVGERPVWKIFRPVAAGVGDELAGRQRFVEEGRRADGRRNVAELVGGDGREETEIVLELRHFCVFAVVDVDVDEVERTPGDRRATVETYVNSVVSAFKFTVHLLVIVSLTDDAMATRQKMALNNGFIKVESSSYLLAENCGGDVNIDVRDVYWMKDSFVQAPPSFTHDIQNLCCGNCVSSLFRVVSESAVSDGVDSSFSCTVGVHQKGRQQLAFAVSIDLHDIHKSPVRQRQLPHCGCSSCIRRQGTTPDTPPTTLAGVSDDDTAQKQPSPTLVRSKTSSADDTHPAATNRDAESSNRESVEILLSNPLRSTDTFSQSALSIAGRRGNGNVINNNDRSSLCAMTVVGSYEPLRRSSAWSDASNDVKSSSYCYCLLTDDVIETTGVVGRAQNEAESPSAGLRSVDDAHRRSLLRDAFGL